MFDVLLIVALLGASVLGAVKNTYELIKCIKDTKKRGEQLKQVLQKESIRYNPSSWEQDQLVQITKNGLNFYSYDKDFGYITYNEKQGYWEVEVSEKYGAKPFLSYTYYVGDGVHEVVWNKRRFSGFAGFVSMSDFSERKCRTLLKRITANHLRKGILSLNETPQSKVAKEDQHNSLLEDFRNERFTYREEKGVIREKRFVFESNDKIRFTWIVSDNIEIIERHEDGERSYRVLFDNETKTMKNYIINPHKLIEIEDEVAFANEEKFIWDAMKEYREKLNKKQRTIQEVWENINPLEKDEMLAEKEEIVTRKTRLFAPYLEHLGDTDKWYIGEKLPGRIAHIRELRETDSLTDQQLSEVYRQIQNRLIEIEENIEAIKHRKGIHLVRLTSSD